jgi:hypothetical protein
VAEQAGTIRDLRTRLDREAEERRKLTAILTGPRAAVVAAVVSMTSRRNAISLRFCARWSGLYLDGELA